MVVLFTIQHLQQRRGGITPVITAYLINLIQKHQRIFHPGLLQSGDNASGHGAHIGTAVSSDFRLIPDAAQADADVLFIQGFRHASCNGGLACSRRSHQTDNRAVSPLCQASDRQEFQDSLLYLLQTVMITLQNLFCPLNICIILGNLIPGQLQKGFQISSFHGGFGASLSQAPETVDFLLYFFLDLPARLQLVQLLLELLRIGHYIIFTQLFTDIVHLLTKHIFLLVFLHPALDLFRKLRPDFGNLDFLIEDFRKHLITGSQIDSL